MPSPTLESSSALAISSTTKSVPQSYNGTSTRACGQCSIYADEVQVLFWPTTTLRTDCVGGAQITAAPSEQVLASTVSKALSSVPVLLNGAINDTAVLDGFTYTFPSTYFSVKGRLGVTNACGAAVGGVYTNPPPIAVSQLTTIKFPDWPTTCKPQNTILSAFYGIFRQEDLACPTWGLSPRFPTTCGGLVTTTATPGAPYNPVILVPTELLNYDPAWQACNGGADHFTLPCGLYDPPRALQTAGGVVANPTPDPTPSPTEQASPGVKSLMPVMVPVPPASEPTDASGQNQGQQQDHDPSNASGQNQINNPSPSNPQQDQDQDPDTSSRPDSGKQNKPGSESGAADPKPTLNGQVSNDPPAHANDQAPPNHGPDPAGQESGQSPVEQPQTPEKVIDPAPHPVPQITVALGGSSPGPSLGASINGALGYSPPSSPGQDYGHGGGQGDDTNAGSQGIPGDKSKSNSESSPGNAPAAGNSEAPSGGKSGNESEGAPGAKPGGESGQDTRSKTVDNAEDNNAPFTPHAMTVLGQSLSALDPTAVVLAGKTLTAGGPAFSTAGNYYSMGPSGNLVAGTLAPDAGGGAKAGAGVPAGAGAAIASTPNLKFGGQSYTADSASQFTIAGQTLKPGQVITVSGTPISEASGGLYAVIGGSSTQSLGYVPITAADGAVITMPPALLTFAGSIYTANPSSTFIISGQTLTPGGSITVSGTVISEALSGSGLAVVGSTTQVLQHVATPGSLPTAAIITLGGSTYTADANGDFVIDGQTLTPGGTINVSGTPVSEGLEATDVVIGGSITQQVGHLTSPMSAITAAVMTLNGHTYTADSGGKFTIDGQTLTPGGIITVSGTPVSEAPGATDVVIGGSTEILGTATTSPSVMQFFGAASSSRNNLLDPTIRWIWWFTACIISALLFIA